MILIANKEYQTIMIYMKKKTNFLIINDKMATLFKKSK